MHIWVASMPRNGTCSCSPPASRQPPPSAWSPATGHVLPSGAAAPGARAPRVPPELRARSPRRAAAVHVRSRAGPIQIRVTILFEVKDQSNHSTELFRLALLLAGNGELHLCSRTLHPGSESSKEKEEGERTPGLGFSLQVFLCPLLSSSAAKKNTVTLQ